MTSTLTTHSDPQALALVRAIEGGNSLRAAAAARSVAPATAHRWWHRWLQASAEERYSSSCLRGRSSRPTRSSRRLTEAQEAPILRTREETNPRTRPPGRDSFNAHARRSGRCFTAMGAPVVPAASARAPATTSGHGPEHSCTWTSNDSCARCPGPPHRGPRSGLPALSGRRLRLPALRHRRSLAARLRRASPSGLREDQHRTLKRALDFFTELGSRPPSP
jgi:hypothetical protein